MIIEVENMKVSLAAVTAALTVAFWLGGLTYMVNANANAIATHAAQEAHPPAMRELSRISTRADNISLLRDEVRRQTQLLGEISNKLARLEGQVELNHRDQQTQARNRRTDE